MKKSFEMKKKQYLCGVDTAAAVSAIVGYRLKR
jgi:hypothetical protein